MIQSCKCIQDSIDHYSKWTRMLVSTSTLISSNHTYDCLQLIMDQQIYKESEYPQKEIYYLIVITWNEGMKCHIKSTHNKWFMLTFKLLQYYHDIQLKNKVISSLLFNLLFTLFTLVYTLLFTLLFTLVYTHSLCYSLWYTLSYSLCSILDGYIHLCINKNN
ncbi:hypothetical protein BDB01DRAFT_133695 [Pilobolus umbonatus]|nr:hypothetical protein BDB01DRAFT_133695 [Pilobolus umbonatus]